MKVLNTNDIDQVASGTGLIFPEALDITLAMPQVGTTKMF